MARTKHTPKNPQLHRPVLAMGRDVQAPRKDTSQVSRKGGKQPRKIPCFQNVEKRNKSNWRN